MVCSVVNYVPSLTVCVVSLPKMQCGNRFIPKMFMHTGCVLDAVLCVDLHPSPGAGPVAQLSCKAAGHAAASTAA